MSRCLGPRVADLTDGRLKPADAERAFAHVASCLSCRAALQAQRLTASRLASDADLAAPDDLLQRLRGIPTQPYIASATVPQQGGAGFRPAGTAGAHPSGRRSRSTHPPRLSRRQRVALASAAGAVALAAVAIVGGGSAALTSTVIPRPAIAPVVDTFAIEHAVSADQMPFSGPRITPVGFTGLAAMVSPSPQP